jgi:hypothetical protein
MVEPYSQHCECLLIKGFQAGIGLRLNHIADLRNMAKANAICR